METKQMKHASKQEFDELTYIMGLKSNDGTKDNLDLIEKHWKLFVGGGKVCRSCPSQLHSIISILKLRYEENKGYLYNKFYNNTPKCERCGSEYVKKYHYDKYCSICAPIVKEEKKYKKRPVIDDLLEVPSNKLDQSKIDDEQGF